LRDSLAIVGLAILIGYVTGKLVGRFKIPAVAGYVIIGVILGQSILNIVNQEILSRLGVVSDLSLGLIAIMIGGELRLGNLRKLSRSLFPIVFLEAAGALILVTAMIQLLFHDWALSFILGAISSATAPTATYVVIREVRASGIFTNTLLAIVAIDDAFALIIYGFASAVSKAMLTAFDLDSIKEVVIISAREIMGALLLGVTAGAVVGPWLRRIRTRESVFTVISGIILVIIGLSNQFHLSSLLANMALGVMITNIAPISSKRVFDTIGTLSPPIFTAFFVIAGAYLRIDLVPSLGLLGFVYLMARIIGKTSGASLGAVIVKAPSSVKKYIGFGLISQVGVAIGLSLIVAKEFTPLGDAGKTLAVNVINVLLATTIVTEIIGPILTKYALIKAGEAKT
jgi:Kef-type K+ transport system membrane component KefB